MCLYPAVMAAFTASATFPGGDLTQKMISNGKCNHEESYIILFFPPSGVHCQCRLFLFPLQKAVASNSILLVQHLYVLYTF